MVEEGSNSEKKPSDIYVGGKEPFPFKVVVKPRSVMGDYIALHGLLPKNELPTNMRGKIQKDEIWMRQDVFENPERRERILQGHEEYELSIMETEGRTYKQAHREAESHEEIYLLEKDLSELEKKRHAAVRIVEPIEKEEAADDHHT